MQNGSCAADPQAVRKQLERILSSEIFLRSERLAALLRYGVEAVLAGNAAGLKEYTIGVDVFGRGQDYDPRVDPLVRVTAARLRSKLDEYYSGPGALDEVRISIPKGFHVPAISFRAQPASSRRIWPWIAAAALLLVSGAFAWNVLRTPARTSVAVLPFVNLSGDAAQEYLAAGLTDQVIDALATIPGLKVVARSSVLQYHGKPVDVRAAGKMLGVAVVVEGTVATEGGIIRVTAKLADTATGYQRWAANFERRNRNLLDLQEELSRGIATLVGGTLRPSPAASPRREKAHVIYLQGRHTQRRNPPEARNLFLSAIAADPSYALPYAGFADTWDEDLRTGRVAYAGIVEERRRYAQKALHLAPGIAESHLAMGRVLQQEWDWNGSLRHRRMAARISPGSSQAHLELGVVLSLMGKFDDAIAEMRKASDLDPASLSPAYNFAFVQFQARRFEDALTQLKRVADFAPDYPLARRLAIEIQLAMGHPAEALSLLESSQGKFPPEDPQWLRVHGVTLAQAGRHKESRLILTRLLESKRIRESQPSLLAGLYAALGDKNTALDYLEKALQIHEYGLPSYLRGPRAGLLQHEERFVQLRKKVGLE